MISVLAPADDPDGHSSAIVALFTELLGPVRNVLFDFDGPLCDLFTGRHRWAPRRTRSMTRQLRALLKRHGLRPPHLQRRNDPHELFRKALDAHEPGSPGLASALRELLEQQERDAALSAPSTPGVQEFVTWLSEQGYKLAVASNNSAAAVAVHLRREHLVDRFVAIEGRATDHRLMKPDPHCVDMAMKEIAADRQDCLMVGDSLADVAAARAAGIHICAFSPKRSKRIRLLAAGATFAVASMPALHEALRFTARIVPAPATRGGPHHA